MGMHCASCAVRVQKKLQSIDGVLDASVNYANEQAFVRFDSEKVDASTIENEIKKTGYDFLLGKQDAQKLDARKNGEVRSLRISTVFGIVGSLFLMGAPMLSLPLFVQWIFATLVQFFVGARFFKGAWSGLLNKTTNMDTLVSLGTGITYVYSSWVFIFDPSAHMYFETASAILTFVSLGKWIELKAKRKTQSAIDALIQLQPSTITIIEDGNEKIVSIAEAVVGQTMSIRATEHFALDGEVIEGSASVDESMITGEPLPITVAVGSKVKSGTINLDGTVLVRITHDSSHSFLTQIITLMKEAQATSMPIQRLIDGVSAIFVPIVLVLAVATFGGWLFLGATMQTAMIYALAVIVIACPCALGLATPISLVVGIGKSAKKGVLIRSALSLEKANGITQIVFDKTGTITSGKPTVEDSFMRDDDEETLSIFSTLTHASTHPLSQATHTFIMGKNSSMPTLSSIEVLSGKGVQGMYNDHQYYFGRILPEISVPLVFEEKLSSWKAKGLTVSIGTRDDQIVLAFAFSDTVREEAKEAVLQLEKMGMQVTMLTGDHQDSAQKIADQVGIHSVIANVLPQEKDEKIVEMQKKGEHVCMTGDGINDAPALARANMSVAIGSGTDVAISASDVILLRNDLRLIPFVFKVSKATTQNIRENIIWAFGYNIVLIPVAMGLFSRWGISLTPMFAGLAMAFSSVSVVLNALRLQWRNL
ncbi:MAG: copper-translocating P-type ATPase [Candidatus Pacebacteria bacterium RIFOXYB1_FULL_44_10]|nr:MAG: copper-translocating P-type ATPase [Candidatus Pacebacteria bacterium RIFOXYB1_FULL_44_10]